MAKNKTNSAPQDSGAPVNPDSLIEVEAVQQVNTSVYGNIYPGEKNRKSIPIPMAAQLEKAGLVNVFPDKSNESAFYEELEKLG